MMKAKNFIFGLLISIPFSGFSIEKENQKSDMDKIQDVFLSLEEFKEARTPFVRMNQGSNLEACPEVVIIKEPSSQPETSGAVAYFLSGHELKQSSRNPENHYITSDQFVHERHYLEINLHNPTSFTEENGYSDYFKKFYRTRSNTIFTNHIFQSEYSFQLGKFLTAKNDLTIKTFDPTSGTLTYEYFFNSKDLEDIDCTFKPAPELTEFYDTYYNNGIIPSEVAAEFKNKINQAKQ